MIRTSVFAFVISASICTSPAMAQDDGAYVELAGGITAANDSDYDSQTDPDIEGTIEWNTGFDLAAAAGYDFGTFRVEGEIALKEHSFDRLVSGTDVLESGPELVIDLTTWSFMANALADFGDEDGIQGFVGGGVGLASTEIDIRDTRSGNNDRDNDTDSGFAWQLLAGVSAPVSDSVAVGLKYRYFNQGDISYIISDDDDFNTDFSSHSILAFARLNF